jgi:MoaA/NifB/PqqE/SkfB family radical SAM enzyme
MIIPITPTLFRDKQFTDKVCLDPFNTVEIGFNGEVSLCGCAAWLPTTIGNIYDHSIDELLNNNIARSIRESIRDSSYRYCNEMACGKISNNMLLSKETLEWTATQTRTPDGKLTQIHGYDLYRDESAVKQPDTYFIAGDRICNLSCPSCRRELITESSDERLAKNQRFNQLNENLFGKSSTNTISIHVSTSGEIFSSRLLFNFLKFFPVDRYPNVEFWLQTNGLLISRKWAEIAHLANNIKNITVTTDSCRPVTYELLRRGGRFKDIERNLQFIQKLKKQFRFEFANRMVVQLDNCEEIVDFYNWSQQFDVDTVEFMRLSNWGTMTASQYAELDVLDPEHKKYADTVAQLQLIKNKNVLLYGFNLG